MPQISKIRIVNFIYNDGNRFIPDELYDLSANSGESLNTLFNLNNGGGKTVLAQLMMQPVNPKAMAGGRRIEDYFARQGDHSYILIEWTTDGSSEKLLTGISIAASISNSSDENQRGNSIKYYTFKTVYEGYSQYNISSLELSKNENGRYVPAPFDYVRERAKASKGVLEYYSSDDSVKWAEELANYGILRSEWETVIETLNKDEGGLNQYFDDAKTSDKLIAKFFIPAIEQKMKCVAGKGADGSLETMLISYAKKISEKETVIQERDTNKKLLAALGELNALNNELYSVNDALVSSIGEANGFKVSLTKRITTIDTEIQTLVQEIEEKNRLLEHIEYEEKSKVYYIAYDRYEQTKSIYEELKVLLDECKKEVQGLRHQEDILQCARLYKIIREAVGRIEELKKLIAEKESDSEDADRIAKLKYSVFIKASEKVSDLENRQKAESESIKSQLAIVQTAKEECDKSKKLLTEVNKKNSQAEAELTEIRKTTDNLVSKLGIDVSRKLDMFYREDEFEAVRQNKIQQRQQLETRIEQLDLSVKELDARRGKIPEEIAQLTVAMNGVETKKEEVDSEIANYNSLYNSLKKLCDKYSLEEDAIFSGALWSLVCEEYDLSNAKANKYEQDRKTFEEKLAAAQNGHIHILPKIMEYVKSTGIPCQTGEEYICSLVETGNMSTERTNEILNNFPELAYAIIFYTENDLLKFGQAGNIDWLPAIVPLLTMDQVARILQGDAERMSCLAAWDREYFADREGYCEKIRGNITECEQQLNRFRQHMEECEEDKKFIRQFDYEESWKTDKEQELKSIVSELRELTHKVEVIKAEHEQVKVAYEETKNQLAECNDNMQNIKSWLDNFAELSMKLNDEIEAYNKVQEVSISKQRAERALKEAGEKLSDLEKELNELRNASNATDKALSDVREIFEKVSNATETEVVDGELEPLYYQYKILFEHMSEDLEKLNVNLGEAIKDKENGEKELSGYQDCKVEEYEGVSFSLDALENIRFQKDAAQKKYDEQQLDYAKSNSEYISSRERMTSAQSALEEYDGVALDRNEIGDDFKNRKSVAKAEIKSISEHKSRLENERQILERTSDKVGNYLEEFGTVEITKTIELSETPWEQWDVIKKEMSTNKMNYTRKKDHLSNKILEVLNEYRDITIAEIIGKLKSINNMLEDVGIKGDRLFTVSESLEMMINSIEKINSQIETDLREIENDFNDIVNQCMNQGKRMYQDLRAIAASSKAHIFAGKPQTQMVKLDLPEEKEISEEASRIAIRTEVENGANEIKALMKSEAEEKEIQKRAKKIVSSQRLLLRYIKKESIQVKVFKIDMIAENSGYKRWEDTLVQSSGAEKFVVFFSVVLTLMNYTRSSAGIVSKNAKSVLILDNPFGKITSAHLLRPMFDIAKHFNVQLICLSDINKSDVINCFECVIKLVIKSQNLSNFEIMTHEGNETIEHGYYKVMNGQMSFIW